MIEKIRDELKTVAQDRGLRRPPRRLGVLRRLARPPVRRPIRTCRSGRPTPRSSSTPAAPPACPRAPSSPTPTSPAMLPLWTRTWLLAPGVPNLVCLPMFHIGGAGWGIAGLFAGATNHVVREFVPAQILRSSQRERLQVMLLVPAMILFLVQAPQIRETDLSSLRLIVYGASPIPAELLKQAMAIFPCGFQQVYGLTETTGAITLLPPEDHDPDRCQEAPVLRLCAEGRRAAHRRRRRQGPADGRGRRDRRALAAGHAAATGSCPRPRRARSRATGSSPATPATSTTRATSTSTTA